jgi:hypothetical protein
MDVMPVAMSRKNVMLQKNQISAGQALSSGISTETRLLEFT